MKENWTYKKLGEVTIKITDGSHNPPAGIDFSEYPMLSSKNVFFDHYNYTEPRYLTKEQFEIEDKRTQIEHGDVLLTIVGTVGRACCIETPFQKFTLQRSVAVLKPIKEIIISRFLMYAITSMQDLFNKEAKGVAQKGIYLKQLSNLSIPVPAVEEQERIVEELDLLSGVIEKQKLQLKELDTLAQSIFYTTFGDPITNEKNWPVKLFGELIKLKSGDSLSAKNFISGNIPVYGGNGISGYHNTYNYDGEYIIIGRVGVYCGNTRLVKGLFWLTDNAFCASFDSMIYHKPFLCYLLNTTNLHRFANQAAQPVISNASLKDLYLPIPPLSLQEEFAEKIELIEKQKDAISKSIKETQKLFDYTMDKYFS